MVCFLTGEAIAIAANTIRRKATLMKRKQLRQMSHIWNLKKYRIEKKGLPSWWTLNEDWTTTEIQETGHVLLFLLNTI